MKNMKILIIILVIGFEGIATAQYCSSFALSKDMVLTYQNYDSEGKETIKSTSTCLDVSTFDSGATIYKVETEITNASDAKLSSWVYELKCEDGKFYVSMGSFTDPELMKKYDNLDIYIDTTGMEYPAELSSGQTLPDAKIVILTAGIGVTMKTYDVIITNRKIIDDELVTTLAGSFDCFKITYDMEVKRLFKKKYHVAEFISEGVGKIKTETYSKNGKLKSSSLLVELVK